MKYSEWKYMYGIAHLLILEIKLTWIESTWLPCTVDSMSAENMVVRISSHGVDLV